MLGTVRPHPRFGVVLHDVVHDIHHPLSPVELVAPRVVVVGHTINVH